MSGKPWDDVQLRAWLVEGKTRDEIAGLSGRTTDAVRIKIRGLKANDVAAKAQRKEPTHEEIYAYMRRPRMMSELCDEFSLGPSHMQDILDSMEDVGYALVTDEHGGHGIASVRPQIATPAITLADEVGMVVSVGVVSDEHNGSRCSQPSAVKRFVEIAAEEYGVRHFLHPGDLTCGVGVYRGQEEDQVPAARAWGGPKQAAQAVRAQVAIADITTPRGVGDHYILGGNHDWASVVKTGLDPIRMLADRRPDVHYLGYDVNRLWLTDKVYIRLWHPSGGVPYAKSYRLQKGIETQAFEALKQAIATQDPSVTSALIAGHLHISLWLPELPIVGLHPGCFEGKTNYLKRKGYEPAVGGTILRFLVTDNGRVQRIEHTWVAFDEVQDDWMNFPIPELPESAYDADVMSGALFSFQPRPEGDRFPIEDPRKGLGPGGAEYVGGK